MNYFSKGYIHQLIQTLDFFPHEQFELMITCLQKACANGNRIFVMGNGGSAATASHFTCDLNKGCSTDKENRFKIICLNDNIPTMLAYANDLAYEKIFIEQMRNFFLPGDVVIGISGSGNSANVIHAIEYAKESRGITIGWCGFDGGALGKLVQVPLIVCSQDMQQIEDVHMIITHITMQRLMSK